MNCLFVCGLFLFFCLLSYNLRMKKISILGVEFDEFSKYAELYNRNASFS